MLIWLVLAAVLPLATCLAMAVWLLIDFAKDYTWHDTKGGWNG